MRRRHLVLTLLIALAVLAGAAVLGSRVWIEWGWFAQFQLTAVLRRRWLFQLAALALGLVVAVAAEVWLSRFWRLRDASSSSHRLQRLRGRGYLAGLGLALVAMLLPTQLLARMAWRLLESPFDARRLHGLVLLADQPLLPLLLLAGVSVLPLLRWPRLGGRLLVALSGVFAATALARSWGVWVPALAAESAGRTDPVFGADLSFTLLRFPALALLLTVGLALVVTLLGSALWGAMATPPQLSDGRSQGFSRRSLDALRPPLALFAALVALSFWLARHQLLLSTSGSVPGAGWLDLHLSLPLRTAASLVAGAAALLLLWPLRQEGRRGPAVVVLALLVPLFSVIESLLFPLLQALYLRPRELVLETPYLARSIEATRRAFQLDAIRTRFVTPRERLTRRDVESSEATIRNIRLWDSQPLLATNRQLQQLRVYYRFSDPVVDRYQLKPPGRAGRQQVIMVPRELDQAALPERSRTWLNRHLVFTHGYGFTLSPVNTRGPDGLPEFFIQDLGASTRVSGSPQLGISAERVAETIPIGRPALYFGALPSPYALAPSGVEEFHYPQGDDNVYTHYDGRAGVPIGRWWQRLAAALYLGEPKLLTRGSLREDTRLLLRREVRARLRAMAPFIRFDAEPYLISVSVPGDPFFSAEQHQYWVVDGFTTSRSYPYSAPVPSDPDIRYLRNAVKAVVDAYNGSVRLYVNEPDDPVIRTWQRMFPELFAPLQSMPAAIQAHVMYPRFQFERQTEQLLRYHVTDPRVFYSGDDVWQVPQELYGRRQVPVEPYHISAQLDSSLPPEFLLLQPLTPLARPNLAGWLVARSDAPNYGELVLLRFPSQTPIYGPEQIQALINQNPLISQQFGLWDRAGSEVIQGNLLVVPVGEALLYVEPVYLRARNGGLPTLTRVVVSDGRRIAMKNSLEEGIDALLDPAQSVPATVPLDQPPGATGGVADSPEPGGGTTVP
ncbi:UPF0182 family protein [Synechococcus sp. RSCCF101]|nr:UPF0182 family protein [Synechococcus sp. RSCCF101]